MSSLNFTIFFTTIVTIYFIIYQNYYKVMFFILNEVYKLKIQNLRIIILFI